MMGRRWVVALLLVSLSFSQGFGRRVKTVSYHGRRQPHPQPLNQEKSNSSWGAPVPVPVPGRKTVEVVNDYDDPKANTNPRNGALFFYPPPSPPAPAPPPPPPPPPAQKK